MRESSPVFFWMPIFMGMTPPLCVIAKALAKVSLITKLGNAEWIAPLLI